ncbi:MAG: helix-turn-helix domain-containing protein [Tepidisphaeraceae bacterium]
MIVLSPHTANTLSPLTADNSWVMFVQVNAPVGATGPIKIEGVRGARIAARLREIAADNAYETYIIGLTPTDNPDEMEQAIHQQFASTHLHHGWFDVTPELIAFVQHTAQEALQALLAQTRPGGVPDGAVDIEALAEFLNVSVPTIRRAVKTGAIPYFKVGKSYRFVVNDVLASLNQRAT